MDKLLPPGVVIVDNNEATGLIPGLTLKLAELDRVRRGDFVRLLLKFTRPATEYAPANPKATEFVTCVVSAINRPPLPFIECKVFSRPENTNLHSVVYGDGLAVSERYVVTHEHSSEVQAKEIESFLTGVVPEPVAVNAEDAKLRQASQNLPALAPTANKHYWLRNGSLVTVWTFHNGVWVGGSPDWQGEWRADGSSPVSRDLDIVRDPTAIEVGA